MNRTTIVLIAVLVGATTLGAQRQRFKAGVDLVHFSVVVTDKQGAPITGLKVEDFELVEEKTQQKITYFLEGDAAEGDDLGAAMPLHIGLGLDSSGSMERDIRDVRTAIIKFLNGNQSAIDFTLIDFDTEIRTTRYGADETERLIERIRMRKPDGWTAFYDAIGVYLNGAGPLDGQKILLVYTDGGDTRSELTQADILDLLKSSDVTMYADRVSRVPVEFFAARTTEHAQADGGNHRGAGLLSDERQRARQALREDPAGDRVAIQPRLRVHGHSQGRRLAEGLDQAETARPEGYETSDANRIFRAVQPRQLSAPNQASTMVRSEVVSPPWGALCTSRDMTSNYDRFKLVTDFELRGDQARAIDELVEGLNRGDKAQVLLGVTGSGKTFTMAQCIARVNRPTLVMAHNKTLAAQLYQEFRRFFPENAVEYFVSYYDYYQPEAYVPRSRLVHREGSDGQRRDRPHAALRDAIALRAA